MSRSTHIWTLYEENHYNIERFLILVKLLLLFLGQQESVFMTTKVQDLEERLQEEVEAKEYLAMELHKAEGIVYSFEFAQSYFRLREIWNSCAQSYFRLREIWNSCAQSWIRPREIWNSCAQSWIRPREIWNSCTQSWIRPREIWNSCGQSWIRPR